MFWDTSMASTGKFGSWWSILMAATAALLLALAFQMALWGRSLLPRGTTWILPIVLSVGVGFGIVLIYRWSLGRSIHKLSQQFQSMIDSREAGLVMLPEGDELAEIARPINAFLSTVVAESNRLAETNRELSLEVRLAAAEKEQVETIILSISDAVLVTNRFDELVLANHAAEALFEFGMDGAKRKPIDEIAGDPTLVCLIREMRNKAGTTSGRRMVEHLIERDGESRVFNVTLSAIREGSQDPLGVVVVLHDVTREREIAQMKTDFVSSVSHELKTPLTAIKAYTEMLMDGEAHDPQTRDEFYQIISSETDRLYRLIENILNISRIESGVVKVVREPLSLTRVVKQAMDVAGPQASQKGIVLESRLAPMYCQVEGDHDMIYQAVLNLLSNAIKYTPEGGSVRAAVEVDERRQVVGFEVVDTGQGIPVKALPHIFDRFYRVKENNGMAKGTGLGLTLVKHIVETVHDGRLSVESHEGEGSAFRFELPILRG
jgi:two-component system phosphate regulon sensor histidine kinase PhoR